ncbi:MAG TPA: 2OG-Fe(II) oxygenase [Frateuria sp.]|uniref:2OG-Fe(II) oxygenase n=1 Tax=Frateuria sp. TaxID=2211372 RepID=UPI002D808769|nr:2OG-Fe(II) oxygenase [Frateuria sp.]HET6804719.1 2OG-Fe(II) oxygenase [Frateuria sp.]
MSILAAIRAYVKQAFRWQKGRQGTGYDKMLLLAGLWPLSFDSYLIRYPEGSEVPPHTDPVQQGRHYRLNLVLKSPRSGGEFVCSSPIFATRRIKLFRPDACEHSVTRVVGGSRYVLSLGWVLRQNGS